MLTHHPMREYAPSAACVQREHALHIIPTLLESITEREDIHSVIGWHRWIDWGTRKRVGLTDWLGGDVTGSG